MIPVVQQRVDIRKTLMERELSSKITYFEILQLLVEQQEELSVQKSHLQEAEAAAAAIRETRGQAVAEYRHTLSDELAKAEQKAGGLAQDLIKAEQKTTAAATDRAGRRRGAAARDPHRRRRRHARAGAAGDRAQRQPAGNRGDGVEPRHRLRPSRTGRRDQDRYLQFHPLRPAARRGARACRRTPSSATSRRTAPATAGRAARTTPASRRARS